jgi:hypothetical protein
MTTKLWSAFLSSTLLAGLATYSITAHAFARHNGAMSCTTDPQQLQTGWKIVDSQLQWSDTNTNKGRLFCPVLHDDSLPVKSINWIFLQGWDANPTPSLPGWFRATPCVSFWGRVGGTCGTVQGTGGIFTGRVDLSIDPSGAFFHSSSVDYRDYPFVAVEVPAVTSNGGVSSLWGLVWGS